QPVHDLMLINPKLKSHSVQETYIPGGEGCLSVDEDIDGIVHRHKRFRVTALDIDGNEVEIKAKGLLAIVLQHEMDHLDGIMFYEYSDKNNTEVPNKNAVPVE